MKHVNIIRICTSFSITNWMKLSAVHLSSSMHNPKHFQHFIICPVQPPLLSTIIEGLYLVSYPLSFRCSLCLRCGKDYRFDCCYAQIFVTFPVNDGAQLSTVTLSLFGLSNFHVVVGMENRTLKCEWTRCCFAGFDVAQLVRLRQCVANPAQTHSHTHTHTPRRLFDVLRVACVPIDG